jgi:single-strand DNA-binding protein
MSMAADNHTTIVGNLVDDPELRFTNTGVAVANMRVAVTQRIQQDGEWRDGDTSFLRVNCNCSFLVQLPPHVLEKAQ